MLDVQTSLSLALPRINKLTECAHFSKTVLPFLPQLKDVPQQIWDNFNDLQALKSIYLSTNPLATALGFALFLVPVVLIVSEVNKNYSQVDRLWSILPVLYNCHYNLWAHLAGLPSARLDHVMAVRGYNEGTQDYRLEIVKDYVGPYVMFAFNVVFISFAQSLLLCAITAPTYILLLCSRISGDTFSVYDNVIPKLIFALVLAEFYADQQQWNYHQAKDKYKRTAKVPQELGFTRAQLDLGFNTTGLFSLSRHPNFAAEQAVWVSLYQWSCCESFTYMNWAFSGAFAYLLLFQASTWLTELLSCQKYPEYRIYQQRVGKFLPKRKTESMEGVRAEEGRKVTGREVDKNPLAKEVAKVANKTKRG